MTFRRDRNVSEVDFVIGDEYAVQVKGSAHVHRDHMRSLQMLSKEISIKKRIIVCMESEPRLVQGIWILPWKIFLNEL